MLIRNQNIIIVALFFLLAGCSKTVEHDGNWFYTESMNAYRNGDYKIFLKYTQKANELLPGRLTILYNLACGYSLNSKPDKTFQTINLLIDKGLPVDVESDPDFDNIRSDKRYPDLLEKLAAARQPVSNSELAFLVPEKDLIPEGLAYDPIEKCFYLGSIYKSKIIKIPSGGIITDFTQSRQDGLVSVIGMKVDPDLHILWANSSYGYKKDNIPFEELGSCEMVKYDLQTGVLLERYSLPKEENHFFNDVAINSRHDAYITDSHVPAVYLVDYKANKLVKYIDLPTGSYPNGITLNTDETLLFVALNEGIMIIDLRNQSSRLIKHSENMHTGGCDGLYFYENSLIGIQSFLSRIARFYLNTNQDEITSIEILESYNPDFETPTTGAIAGNEFYYIANAQLGKIDREGSLAPVDQLNPVKIMKVILD